MTTIVVVRKGREVAIAADSQSTFGETRLDAQWDARWQKVFEFQGSYIGISGSAAHDLVLQSALTKIKQVDLSSRLAIYDTFCRLHPILKDTFYLNPKEDEEDPYESNHMEILIANAHGIFGVYSMREVYEYTRFWAIGSGAEFALGAMHASYARARDAKRVAELAMAASADFDVHSSLPMSIHTAALGVV